MVPAFVGMAAIRPCRLLHIVRLVTVVRMRVTVIVTRPGVVMPMIMGVVIMLRRGRRGGDAVK